MNKHISKILISLIILIIILSAFSGCQKKETVNTDLKNIEIIISDKTYKVITSKIYLHEVLIEMKDKGVIVYDYSESSYGAMINNIDGMVNNNQNNKYISLFHNIENIEFIDFTPAPYGKDAIVIGEDTFKYSSVGVSMMPVIEGGKYLFVLA